VKYVSYSLYGSNDIYKYGLIRNIDSVFKLLPDYKPLVYLEKDADESFKHKLASLGAEVRTQDKYWHENGMFWRFQAIFEKNAERILVRDCDSDIIERDVAAVREWENSKFVFHIMRDHPLHTAPILGGMWGAVVEPTKKHFDRCDFLSYGKNKGQDQLYLASLYPALKNLSLIHDSFFRFEKTSKRFPTERVAGEFVGESLDELGRPLSKESRDLLFRVEGSRLQMEICDFRFRFQMLKTQVKYRFG